MISHQASKIMSTGLAEQVVQGPRELPLPFLHIQMQSLLEISSRFCKKQGRLWVLHCLPWPAQVVLHLEVCLLSFPDHKCRVCDGMAGSLTFLVFIVFQVPEATSDQGDGVAALATEVWFQDLIPFLLVQGGLGSCCCCFGPSWIWKNKFRLPSMQYNGSHVIDHSSNDLRR